MKKTCESGVGDTAESSLRQADSQGTVADAGIQKGRYQLIPDCIAA